MQLRYLILNYSLMDIALNQYAMHYAVSTPLLKTFHHSALSFRFPQFDIYPAPCQKSRNENKP